VDEKSQIFFCEHLSSRGASMQQTLLRRPLFLGTFMLGLVFPTAGFIVLGCVDEND
ncbi:uncharacterized protein METZ01_LOCUS76959, partial [marine metagenome]|tara:strand:- start:8596 stop:8763 length:168 start_codon:yes stop_codon:yes gene_type:complete